MRGAGFLRQHVPPHVVAAVTPDPMRRSRVEKLVDGLFNYTDYRIIGLYAARELTRDPDAHADHEASRRRVRRMERLCADCGRAFHVRLNRETVSKQCLCAGCARIVKCECGRRFLKPKSGRASPRCRTCRRDRLCGQWKAYRQRVKNRRRPFHVSSLSHFDAEA